MMLNLPSDNEATIVNMLLTAVRYGHVDDVQRVLISSEFQTSHDAVNTPYKNAFIEACTYGQLEIARYLLSHLSLENDMNMGKIYYLSCEGAAFNGHLHILDFLFTIEDFCVADVLDKAFFVNIIERRDLNVLSFIVKYCNKEKSYRISVFYSEMLKMAAYCGYGDIVHYLLTSHDIDRENVCFNKDDALSAASLNGHLDVIKYLLTSTELTDHANVNASNTLCNACLMGHLDVVKYLLASPDLKEHADIHSNNNIALHAACGNGNVDIVHYLLLSPELNEHANVLDKSPNLFSTNLETMNAYEIACSQLQLDLAVFILTYNKDLFVPFQSTEYDIQWAVHEGHHDLVYAMLQTLLQHDPQSIHEHINTVLGYYLIHDMSLYILFSEKFHIPTQHQYSDILW